MAEGHPQKLTRDTEAFISNNISLSAGGHAGGKILVFIYMYDMFERFASFNTKENDNPHSETMLLIT